MAEGRAGFPGYAYFFIIAESEKTTPSEKASLDSFKSIFEQTLGFRWVNQDLLVRTLTRETWDHKKRPYEDRHQPVNPGQCCVLCHMKTLDFSNVEYVMIGMHSHGAQYQGNDLINLWNGSFLFLVEIVDALSDKNFPALKGKKRILVFDCCRKDINKSQDTVADYGQSVETMNMSSGLGFGSNTAPMGTGAGDKETAHSDDRKPKKNVRMAHRQSSTTYIETQPDNFLIIHGTTPGRVTYSNETYGSWMLQGISQAISDHNFERPLNFLHTLTKAAQIMSKKETIVFGTDGNRDYSQSFRKAILYTSNTLRTLPMFCRPVIEPILPAYEPMDQDLPTNYSFFGDDSRDPSRK